MSLRGQGSLQQLLGKRIGKKPAGKQRKQSSSLGAGENDAEARTKQATGATKGSKAASSGTLHRLFSKQASAARRANSSSSGGSSSSDASANPGPSPYEAHKDVAVKRQPLGSLASAPRPKSNQPSAKAAVAVAAGPATTGAAASEHGPWIVDTRIVGRKYRQAVSCSSASQLRLEREPDNVADPNAIKVMADQSGGGEPQQVGHLPAEVAAVLCPLMDTHGVQIVVRLREDGGTGGGGATGNATAIATANGSTVLAELQLLVSALIPPARRATLVGDIHAAVAAIAAAQQRASSGDLLRSNFLTLVGLVREHDLQLLSNNECALLDAFERELQPPAQCLFLRLYLRRGPWFQLGSINYPETADVEAAAAQAAAVGLMLMSANADVATACGELAQLLPWSELRNMLPSPGMKADAPPARKAELLQRLQERCSSSLAHRVHAALGPCVRIAPAAHQLVTRLQRIYFLNEGQDISRFLATDRGVINYPTYSIVRRRPAFASRPSLLAYEQALRHAALLDEALEAGDIAEAQRCLQPAWDSIERGDHKQVHWRDGDLSSPNSPHLERAQGHHVSNGPDANLAAVRAEAGIPATAEGSVLAAAGMAGTAAPAAPQHDSRPEDDAACTDGVHMQNPNETSTFSTHTPKCSTSPGSLNRQSSAGCTVMAPLATPSKRTAAHLEPSHHADSDPNDVHELPHPPHRAVDQEDSHLTRSQVDCARADCQPGAVEPADATPLFLARFCAAWVYTGMATVGVSLLEKQRNYPEAVAKLQVLLGGNCCPARRGEWWLRLSLDLEHAGQATASLEMAEAALADAWVRHGDRLALQRRVLRLGKPPLRWKRPTWAPQLAQAEPPELRITGRPLASSVTVGTRNRYYGPDGQLCCVEELALQHYATPAAGGWRGVHTEGGIWATLFGLLMWDVLFMSLPDVFRTPFQTAPLDLDTDAFYPARRAAVDARLQDIALDRGIEIIRRTWAQHEGVWCRGVTWNRFSLEEVEEIASCIGGLGLSVTCRLLAEDHGGWGGGMPDLLLWKPQERVAKLVEVKGPRDRLSEQQRAWIAAFAAVGIRAEVCKVLEPVGSGAK